MQIATQKHTHKCEKARQIWYVQEITILPSMNLVILEWLKCRKGIQLLKIQLQRGRRQDEWESKGVKTETWTQQYGRESQWETAWKTPARNVEKKILLKSRANQHWWIWLRRINTRGERQDWVSATYSNKTTSKNRNTGPRDQTCRCLKYILAICISFKNWQIHCPNCWLDLFH